MLKRSVCRWFAIVTSILVLGCSHSWEKNPNREYSIWISPQFTDSHREMIANSVKTWDEALNDYLGVSITTNQSDASITVFPSTVVELYNEEDGTNFSQDDVKSKRHRIGYCKYGGIKSRIQIAVDVNEGDFKWVALHEFGHAFGLQHTGSRTLMCDVDSCASGDITSDDLSQLHKVWE